MKGLNINMETIKLSEENTGVHFFFDLELGSSFLDETPKPQVTKEKIDKLDYIRMKNNFVLQINKKVKRHPQNEKKLAILVSNQGLVSITHKIHNSITKTKTNSPSLKQAKNFKSHFSKEDITMTNKHAMQ